MSNGYDVQFDLSNTKIPGLLSKLDINVQAFSTDTNPGGLINLFCDEAQLPNMQASTGQLTGRHLGEGMINYPHTRMVSDFSLTWMCDANMAPYKFLTVWYNYIFGEFNTYSGANSSTNISQFILPTGSRLEDVKEKSRARPRNRINKLKYPNDYQALLRITKTERGRKAPNSRASLVYAIEDCYPYSIDAVPLSYGASQVTKVTANFYYSRHSIYYNDIRKNYGG